MSGAFTPGPWLVGPPHVVRRQYRDEQKRRVTQFIAECANTHGHESETEANAHLIAAAPELYEALADALKMIGAPVEGLSALDDDDIITVSFSVDGFNLKRLHAALAKARGEQVQP